MKKVAVLQKKSTGVKILAEMFTCLLAVGMWNEGSVVGGHDVQH